MNEQLNLPNKTRNAFLGISALGLLLVIIGIFVHSGQTSRLWASFLLGNFYFTAISITALVWIGINYIANAGWAVAFKRIPEAMASYLPIGFIGMLILVIFTFIPLGGHHSAMHSIYEWMNLDNPEIANDPVLQGKSPLLNQPFFILRIFIYFAIWIAFQYYFRKYSLREDAEGGLRYYDKSVRLAAAFVPVYALTFCLASYDWVMSIEPHWYSTIYAINLFAGALVTACAIMALTAFILKRYGYMPYVNDSHFHDLGKYIFGFSIFWTYTWVAQFLLIWYANIPEETIYYYKRMHGDWNILFFVNLTINFVFPFFALMTRNAKRTGWLIFVIVVLLIGRFIDFYIAIMPGSAADQSGLGFYEIGFFLLFGGLFAFIMAYSLAKANLAPKHHPYLGESIHHDI